jgi:hypothetical protein
MKAVTSIPIGAATVAFLRSSRYGFRLTSFFNCIREMTDYSSTWAVAESTALFARFRGLVGDSTFAFAGVRHRTLRCLVHDNSRVSISLPDIKELKPAGTPERPEARDVRPRRSHSVTAPCSIRYHVCRVRSVGRMAWKGILCCGFGGIVAVSNLLGVLLRAHLCPRIPAVLPGLKLLPSIKLTE